MCVAAWWCRAVGDADTLSLGPDICAVVCILFLLPQAFLKKTGEVGETWRNILALHIAHLCNTADKWLGPFCAKHSDSSSERSQKGVELAETSAFCSLCNGGFRSAEPYKK